MAKWVARLLATLGATYQNVASRVFKRQVVTLGIALIVLPSLYAANGVSDVRLAHLELRQLGCQAKCGKPPRSLGTLFGTNENVPDGCFTWMVVRQKYNCANLGGKGGAPCLLMNSVLHK